MVRCIMVRERDRMPKKRRTAVILYAYRYV
jgi:hypothetical protein